MKEWEKKGKKEWRKNQATTQLRHHKEDQLEQWMTQKHITKIKSNINFATTEVVDGIDEFEKNLQRLGIEDGANLDALDKPEPTEEELKKAKKSKPLGGFSYAATMNKIKETKKKGDVARKVRDRLRRKMLVNQVKTQASVESKNREEELLTKFSKRVVDERQEGFKVWRNQQCKVLKVDNRLNKESEMKSNFEN